ncbi:hypothetical protein NDU88_001123 [Pleurodeles waltl]|uniref:Uncharacterized protein n=1 Tax=Pleurodeles waltl TaxID=8319 RepID=A0AAV7NE93_PLEWA|nr:hypothetical protein NDU88_001123 [Pleurodeles waltl]
MNPPPQDCPDTAQGLQESIGSQILAAIDTSSTTVQAKREAVSQDIDLLRVDLRKVVRCSMATEEDVSKMQREVALMLAELNALVTRTNRSKREPKTQKVGPAVVSSASLASRSRWRDENEDHDLEVWGTMPETLFDMDLEERESTDTSWGQVNETPKGVEERDNTEIESN